ncbi:MAG TPA: AAA family ATPase [Ramlibacter sp.]|uniref:ExeA family protein n=1 Tax=Ramlibacter sp. TaxID=1917967 RepID=UPI002BE494CF|nr:AAA family ATPase [Ramlibacter sp.]HVZ44343.1 AAA family ATPase [Ramlibacter sp.]
MYTAYFGLKFEPFSIAPDPRLLFMSERHREALAHLLYGVRGGGGFVLLTGEIGTGKTTVSRCFLEQVPPECNVAYIFNPKLTVLELLQTVCHEFGVDVPRREAPTVKEFLDPLNAFLLREHAAGRNNVLVIDEAQNLSADVLEQLRLLTNLETSERKLLQIVLIGQPELREMVARPELEQLAQRVIARYHLQALGEAETLQYVRHRMDVAGLERPLPFDRGALKRIHRLTGGVPRRINLLCDRALLGAYGSGQATVTRRIVDRAASEVFDAGSTPKARWRRPAYALGLALAAGAGLVAATRTAEHDTQNGTQNGTQIGTIWPPDRAAITSSVAPAAALPAANAGVQRDTPAALIDNRNDAWRVLARGWKADVGEGDACDALQRQHVQCFSARRIGLALIRELDRPGIVRLDAGSIRPSYAILTALGEHSATLRAGGREQVVTLAALAERWDGDFSTLWRSPEGYSPGRTAAPAIAWLAGRLDTASAKGKTRAGDLTNEIRVFQSAHGLPADGMPGPMTFMQANRVSGVDEPRLAKAP